MTSPSSSPRDGLQQEVAALTTALHGVDRRLKSTLSTEEVHIRLARAKAEVATRRRRTFALVIFLLFLALQAADHHTEQCRIGAVQGGILRPLDPKTQFVCDFTNPTHVHVFGDIAYPTAGNIAGVAFYTALFLGIGLWNAYQNRKAWERAAKGLDPDVKKPLPPGAG